MGHKAHPSSDLTLRQRAGLCNLRLPLGWASPLLGVGEEGVDSQPRGSLQRAHYHCPERAAGAVSSQHSSERGPIAATGFYCRSKHIRAGSKEDRALQRVGGEEGAASQGNDETVPETGIRSAQPLALKPLVHDCVRDVGAHRDGCACCIPLESATKMRRMDTLPPASKRLSTVGRLQKGGGSGPRFVCEQRSSIQIPSAK